MGIWDSRLDLAPICVSGSSEASFLLSLHFSGCMSSCALPFLFVLCPVFPPAERRSFLLVPVPLIAT